MSGRGRRLENESEGLGAQLWEAEVPVESIGSLSLSTQTAGSVGSFQPWTNEQVVFSEGAGLIRHRREGPAHKSQLVLLWPGLVWVPQRRGDEGYRGMSSLGSALDQN